MYAFYFNVLPARNLPSRHDPHLPLIVLYTYLDELDNINIHLSFVGTYYLPSHVYYFILLT